MTASVRLFLVRHGETALNREMRYLGTRDEPLTERGVLQAESLARAFEGLPMAAVLSSPLLRAVETGRPIARACGVAFEIEDRLREGSFGEWEGKTRQEILDQGEDAARLLRAWESDARAEPPGGESFTAIQEQVVGLASSLARERSGSWVVLVSHVGPLKALLCKSLGLPLEAARRMFLDPGTISVVDWGDVPILRLFNSHGHLGWNQARWMR